MHVRELLEMIVTSWISDVISSSFVLDNRSGRSGTDDAKPVQISGATRPLTNAEFVKEPMFRDPDGGPRGKSRGPA